MHVCKFLCGYVIKMQSGYNKRQNSRAGNFKQQLLEAYHYLYFDVYLKKSRVGMGYYV